MAKIFLSYKSQDRELATSIQVLLERRGHTLRSDINALGVGPWRNALMDALMESDVVVVLLTERAIASNFVAAEIGAARALAETTKKMGLFPIVVGSIDIPRFVQDLNVARLCSTDPESLDLIVKDIDQAVTAYMANLADRNRRKGRPRIFISHRHKDEPIAASLVAALQAAFRIEREDIRCTSVQPFRLPVGMRTADQLRTEIQTAEVVIGILTPDTKESSYVLFELGAAWAHGVCTCPLLACGGTISDIPDPIRDLSPLSLSKEEDCQQLLDDLADSTSLERREKVAGDIQHKVRALVESAQASEQRGVLRGA